MQTMVSLVSNILEIHADIVKAIGGQDNAIVVDLKHFQQFSMDKSSWQATIGGGTLLGDVTDRLHENGKRAMAHGTCPQVGIGGHATIGGLGPSSRMWGAALDHVEEVEVVLANSSIVRASEKQNADVFWALKGAGASFGIITEFKVRFSSPRAPHVLTEYRSAPNPSPEKPSSTRTASKPAMPPPKPTPSKSGRPSLPTPPSRGNSPRNSS